MNANADLKSEVAEESAEAQPPSTCTPATAPLLVDPAPSEQSDGPNLWSKIRGIHKRAVACMVFQIMCGLWLLLLKSRTPFRRFQQECAKELPDISPRSLRYYRCAGENFIALRTGRPFNFDDLRAGKIDLLGEGYSEEAILKALKSKNIQRVADLTSSTREGREQGERIPASETELCEKTHRQFKRVIALVKQLDAEDFSEMQPHIQQLLELIQGMQGSTSPTPPSRETELDANEVA